MEQGRINTIVDKVVLADFEGVRIVQMEIFAPHISKAVRPGQFIILMVSREGERIPLTVVRRDLDKNTITIIFQEVGFTTKILGRLNKGGSLYSLSGPLGHPTEITNYGKVAVIGGGVGIAEIFPLVKEFKEAGCWVYSILGARADKLLILKDEIRKYSDELYISTDDGSIGDKGFVTDILKRLLEQGKNFELVYCVGPLIMMRAVALLTKKYNIKTVVCLNTIMVDGTGMCGSCRLREAGKVKFCCVDGPDFDAHLVDFDDLIQRQGRFFKEEKKALDKLSEK